MLPGNLDGGLKEGWSSQLYETFAVAKRKPEVKVQACTGFKPLTSAKPVQRSNNLTNKPTGSRSLNWFVINPWQDDDGEVMNNEMGALREFNLVEDTCISSPQNKNAKWKSPSTRRLEVKQPRIKKQIRTSTRWINHPGLVHTKFYSRHWLIQSFIYVCRIIRGGDVGWGLKQRGIIVKAFFPWKGGLIRGGGLNRGFKILSLLFFLPLRCQKKSISVVCNAAVRNILSTLK